MDNEYATRDSLDDPPDFEMFLDAYTVFRVNASWTVDGQAVPYTAIRIIDNKGYAYSPLTKITATTMINPTSTNIGALLNYNFSFVLSQFLGTIPAGWLADWTVGAVFSVLQNMNNNTSVSSVGNGAIYTMHMVSVTEMSYLYVYNSAGVWDLCGVKANSIAFARSDIFSANIAGEPYSEARNFPTQTSGTGLPVTGYIEDYARYGYKQTHYPGELYVYGAGNRTYNITLGFARLPSFLIQF